VWGESVDPAGIELALMELRPLLDAVAAAGSSMLIKIDGERSEGVNPRAFTVVISGGVVSDRPIRFDDSDLVRAVTSAMSAFDADR
jgi:hypothetical protein